MDTSISNPYTPLSQIIRNRYLLRKITGYFKLFTTDSSQHLDWKIFNDVKDVTKTLPCVPLQIKRYHNIKDIEWMSQNQYFYLILDKYKTGELVSYTISERVIERVGRYVVSESLFKQLRLQFPFQLNSVKCLEAAATNENSVIFKMIYESLKKATSTSPNTTINISDLITPTVLSNAIVYGRKDTLDFLQQEYSKINQLQEYKDTLDKFSLKKLELRNVESFEWFLDNGYTTFSHIQSLVTLLFEKISSIRITMKIVGLIIKAISVSKQLVPTLEQLQDQINSKYYRELIELKENKEEESNEVKKARETEYQELLEMNVKHLPYLVFLEIISVLNSFQITRVIPDNVILHMLQFNSINVTKYLINCDAVKSSLNTSNPGVSSYKLLELAIKSGCSDRRSIQEIFSAYPLGINLQRTKVLEMACENCSLTIIYKLLNQKKDVAVYSLRDGRIDLPTIVKELKTNSVLIKQAGMSLYTPLFHGAIRYNVPMIDEALSMVIEYCNESVSTLTLLNKQVYSILTMASYYGRMSTFQLGDTMMSSLLNYVTHSVFISAALWGNSIEIFEHIIKRKVVLVNGQIYNLVGQLGDTHLFDQIYRAKFESAYAYFEDALRGAFMTGRVNFIKYMYKHYPESQKHVYPEYTIQNAHMDVLEFLVLDHLKSEPSKFEELEKLCYKYSQMEILKFIITNSPKQPKKVLDTQNRSPTNPSNPNYKPKDNSKKKNSWRKK